MVIYDYKYKDINGDGSIDMKEFLTANMIASQEDIEPKVTWLFQLIDEDKSGTIEKHELRKFLSYLLETSSFISDEETNIDDLYKTVYPILDEEKKGIITLNDFIKVTKNNKKLNDLVTSYTSIISYKIELEKHKESIDDVNSLDQVAGKLLII
jgi:Ca2+-binding EF-hand superfamily protein